MQMAIVKMSNFSLFAFDSERENLLHELQRFKYVHFLDLGKDESLKEKGLENVKVPEKMVEVDEKISKVKYIIDILSQYDERETGIKAMKKGLDTFDFKELEQKALSIEYLPTYDELTELNIKKDALLQELVKLKTSIEELTPWIHLDAPIRTLNSFEQSEVYMGTVPKKLKEKLDMELLENKYTYFEVISEDKESLYILVISSKAEAENVIETLKNNNFSDVKLSIQGTPEEEISGYAENIRMLEKEISELEQGMKSLIHQLGDIEIVYDYLMNKKLRIASSENFLKTQQVDLIKGYIPTEMVEEFTQVVRDAVDHIYYLEMQEAQDEDPEVPILLQNSKFTESFESLTAMYALPKYNEVDPTPFLAPFYLVFFGMMSADIGYGLVMLIATMVVLKTFNLSKTTRSFMKFFYYLSYSVIIWGILYGSIFGGIIPMKGLFTPAEDYNILLIISIGFGLIHIFYGLAIKAYVSIKNGKPMDAVYDVGIWFVALLGSIGFLLSVVMGLSPMLKNTTLIMMIAGMVGIVLFGARDSKSIVGRLGGGVYELYGITGYVGDFVSYSRLMALGLAGGFIASAVNMMADMVVGAGWIGIIFAPIIFIVGQLFNLGLTLLSAYVHTIRLTFVEFFGKFYEGGGKGFNLFRCKSKYINLK